jgi:hypothetical protein
MIQGARIIRRHRWAGRALQRANCHRLWVPVPPLVGVTVGGVRADAFNDREHGGRPEGHELKEMNRARRHMRPGDRRADAREARPGISVRSGLKAQIRA